MRLRIATVLGLAFFGGVAVGSEDATQSYTRDDVGLTVGSAVNASGVVAGYLYDDYGDPTAAIWDPATQQTIDLGIYYSWAMGINDDGVVVGGSYQGAFRWEDGTTTYLGGISGYPYSTATGVNASGQIVGYYYDEYGYSRAFLWESDVMTDLGTLGGLSSSAAAINDAGTVVGWSDLADGFTRRAFAWDATDGMSDLGAAEGNDSSQASAIDASGHVAGYSFTMYWYYDEYYGYYAYPGPNTATLFDGGAAIALGGENSHASGILDATADHGVQVVGVATDPADYPCSYGQAAIWEIDAGGQVVEQDLNDLLDAAPTGVLTGASSINALGVILASDGYAAALLTPSTLPPVPQVLYAPANPTGYGFAVGVALSWSQVCGADTYEVQRGTSAGGPYDTIATGLTQTSYSDTSAQLGTTYYYVMAGVAGSTVGALSAEVSAAPRPFAPTNLTARLGRGKNKYIADLTWTASASSNIAHYKVYTYDYSFGWRVLATLGPVTSYRTAKLARRTTHYFYVTAVHAGGQESDYASVYVTTPR